MARHSEGSPAWTSEYKLVRSANRSKLIEDPWSQYFIGRSNDCETTKITWSETIEWNLSFGKFSSACTLFWIIQRWNPLNRSRWSRGRSKPYTNSKTLLKTLKVWIWRTTKQRQCKYFPAEEKNEDIQITHGVRIYRSPKLTSSKIFFCSSWWLSYREFYWELLRMSLLEKLFSTSFRYSHCLHIGYR